MMRFLPYLLLLPLVFASCLSTPPGIEEMQAEVNEESASIIAVINPEELQEITAERETTESLSVHEMYYDPVAEADIRQALDNLKLSIKESDYPGWRAVLADDYFMRVTSAKNFEDLNTALQRRRIILTTPEDYFTHVVVPSRTTWANSRIDDDIEFLSADHVRVYEQYTRHRVYELQRIDNQWKVSN